MSNEHPQIYDWRARGDTDKLARYDKIAAANAAAKTRLLALFDEVSDVVATAEDVAASDRARIVDEVRRLRATVAAADLTPHPTHIDRIFADEAA